MVHMSSGLGKVAYCKVTLLTACLSGRTSTESDPKNILEQVVGYGLKQNRIDRAKQGPVLS